MMFGENSQQLMLFSPRGLFPSCPDGSAGTSHVRSSCHRGTILKLVLKYHFWEKDIDPDVAAQKRELAAIARMDDPKEEEKVNVRKQFSLLKEKLGGGLKLALYCLSDRLWQQVQILQMGQSANLDLVQRIGSKHEEQSRPC